jgi:hypothetical protein
VRRVDVEHVADARPNWRAKFRETSTPRPSRTAASAASGSPARTRSRAALGRERARFERVDADALSRKRCSASRRRSTRATPGRAASAVGEAPSSGDSIQPALVVDATTSSERPGGG